jgi:hypothetical protein
VITVTQSYEPPRCKHVLKAERILIVELATAWAQTKEVVLAISREGGQCPTFTRASQNVVVTATLLDMLPAHFADAVDKLYH